MIFFLQFSDIFIFQISNITLRDVPGSFRLPQITEKKYVQAVGTVFALLSQPGQKSQKDCERMQRCISSQSCLYSGGPTRVRT